MNTSKSRIHLLLAFTFSTALHAQSWEQRANLSQPLLDATGFSIGEYGYVFGGYNGSSAQAYLWRYTPQLDVWGAAVQYPGTIVRACAAAGLDGVGYVFGGRTGVNGQYSSALWSYDPSMLQWTQRTSKPGGGLAYSSAFAMNGKLYVFGGSTPSDAYSNELWEYRPDLDQWSMKASLPAAGRSGAIGVVMNGMGYIIGGNDASANFASKDVWQYDPDTDAWTQKADMPGSERRAGCGFELGGLVYAGGGWDGTSYFTDFYTFDPTANSWTPIQDYGGNGAYTPVGFAINNTGYVSTGGTGTGASAQCWAYVNNAISVIERTEERFEPYRNGYEIIVQGSEGSPYTIADASGRTIADGAIRNGRINLVKIPHGVYVLHCTDLHGGAFAWKFVMGE